MSIDENPVFDESERIKAEYRRRELKIPADRHRPWDPAEGLIVSERKLLAAQMLHETGKFPTSPDRCLEIGYGKLGWLADLISWGICEDALYGIELDSDRAKKAQDLLPSAHLEIGDATQLPWENGFFQLIVVSTVYSSVLSSEVRRMISAEIVRVLAPGGVVLWYDLAMNNPKNAAVRGINKAELKLQFSNFTAKTKSLTLAPPLARLISRHSWTLTTFLSAIPMLRTHLLGVLLKP